MLLVDSVIPETGGNTFNIEPVQDHPRLSVRTVDVRDVLAMERLVASQRRHLQPGRPGQPHRLDARPVHRPGDQLPQPALAAGSLPPQRPEAKVVFASTRQIYGACPTTLPSTSGSRPTRSTSTASTSWRASGTTSLYNNVYGIRASLLRLTNTYGPRMLVKNNRQTALGWFIRQALDGEEITVFGDGAQLRDFTYVDDVVDAFLLAGASDAANGQVFNLGGDRADQPARAGRAADRGGRHGQLPTWCRSRPSARRSTSAPSTPTIARFAARSAGSRGRSARGPDAHHRLLPRAPRRSTGAEPAPGRA